ncbi:hypothetical protein C8Q76DRAFT_795955 [Earliella scabrosa]|nr:hypothetical protein C8Q76DRAFT_795955 [Earliella scabrosa]
MSLPEPFSVPWLVFSSDTARFSIERDGLSIMAPPTFPGRVVLYGLAPRLLLFVVYVSGVEADRFFPAPLHEDGPRIAWVLDEKVKTGHAESSRSLSVTGLVGEVYRTVNVTLEDDLTYFRLLNFILYSKRTAASRRIDIQRLVQQAVSTAPPRLVSL